jgi:hypothetical protein
MRPSFPRERFLTLVCLKLNHKLEIVSRKPAFSLKTLFYQPIFYMCAIGSLIDFQHYSWPLNYHNISNNILLKQHAKKLNHKLEIVFRKPAYSLKTIFYQPIFAMRAIGRFISLTLNYVFKYCAFYTSNFKDYSS